MHSFPNVVQRFPYSNDLIFRSTLSADKSSPLASSSGSLQIDSYVKVCWVTFYICIICTVMVYSIRYLMVTWPQQREAKSGAGSANVSMAEGTALELDTLPSSYPVPPPPSAATISSPALVNLDSCVLFVPRWCNTLRTSVPMTVCIPLFGTSAPRQSFNRPASRFGENHKSQKQA